ncbi:MAG: toxin-antitoxin system HicB family antitoxin [Spirochaetales bacterium]|nr:toxin-antitoxin system HicB family antitoxin [Spirochaetales bacterium]
MKTKASLLTLRVPNELKHNIKLMAEQQGISINQLALYALTKEIKEMQTFNQLEKYWSKKNEDEISGDFASLLSRVKEKNNTDDLPDWDKI